MPFSQYVIYLIVPAFYSICRVMTASIAIPKANRYFFIFHTALQNSKKISQNFMTLGVCECMSQLSYQSHLKAEEILVVQLDTHWARYINICICGRDLPRFLLGYDYYALAETVKF